jgi:hypothetical protein
VSAVEIGSSDDFFVGSDTFFANSLCVSSSQCALKISASGVELRFEDYFWDYKDALSSTVSQSAVVYVRRRCHRQA